MPDPAELLAVARQLANSLPQPNDAQLRRAVSTAYYAVFHKILLAAAERFMGPGTESTAGYSLLYRSFDHRHMKTICEHLNAPTMKKTMQTNLRRTTVSVEMRHFARNFSLLQEQRHLADYDPRAAHETSAVSNLVDLAEIAIRAFDSAPPEEQADILALLMVRPRP
jgi:hypothetical protein